MSLTKRRHVNKILKDNVDFFIETAREVIRGNDSITSVNYDLGDISTKQAVDWLSITIKSTHMAKKNWISLRRLVDDVILSLDWYINRCNMDLKRYREKLNGETQIIPRSEFDIPDDWSEEE